MLRELGMLPLLKQTARRWVALGPKVDLATTVNQWPTTAPPMLMETEALDSPMS